jgi:hypothetical protein
VTERDRTVRGRRRREALDSLELEARREEALVTRLESALRDLEAWRADEEAFGRMEPEDAELLRRIGFATRRPAEDARVRLESQAAELEAEIAECRRRQRAYERYAAALREPA